MVRLDALHIECIVNPVVICLAAITFVRQQALLRTTIMNITVSKTLNPIPICHSCGQQTRRAGTTAGKGRYCCTSSTCPDAFKVWYKRGSRKK